MELRTLLFSAATVLATTAMAQTSDDVISKVGSNAGKVGYPTAAAFETYKSTVQASGATDETKTAALTTLLSTANIVMPEDGKAYYIHPVNRDASSTTTYTLYTNSSNQLHFTNATASSAQVFYAHKVDGGYVFTNNAGYYMTFRAEGKEINGAYTGVMSEYNNTCVFSLYPMQYGTADNYDATSSSITGANYNTLGLLLLQGLIEDNKTDKHYLMCNTSQTTADIPFHNANQQVIYYTSDGNTCAYAFEEATQENAFTATAMKIGETDVYLGTYSSPFPVALPEGCEAYTAQLNSASDGVTLVKLDGAVPANTGVIVKATSAATIVPTARTIETLATVAEGSNKLVASTGNAIESSVNAYVLGKDNSTSEPGLYKLDSSSRTVSLFKAYLALTSDGNAAMLNVNFGGTTGVSQAVADGMNTPRAIYDLSGRRVNTPAHGLYIVGGKKVLVK